MRGSLVWRTGVLALLATVAVASSGDRSSDFQNCLSKCVGRCHPWTVLSLDLRLTRWTCTDDCKYTCMHMLTDNAVRDGKPIQQYYGKWPFWRFLGMQEPASVAFSLWNMWFHLQGARQISRRIPAAHPMKPYYLTWAYVSINAWIWSAVFHTRDLPRTEKLDYFSAALAIMYALYFTVTRMLHMYPRATDGSVPKSTVKSRSAMCIAWSMLCIAAYIAHVTYLSILPRFDYSYNMAFNLALGLAHNLLWLLYSLPRSVSLLRRFPHAPKTYRPSYAYKAGLFVALTTAATALELFDFPPVGRVLDAHALWHLSTAPIAKLWYNFLVEDALDEGWRAPQQ
ncbi:Per1-like protein [Pisolithus tinctorius]|nr:Per1-like protein [Pisolithus tinctorius]